MIPASTRPLRKTIDQLADQYQGQLRHHGIEAERSDIAESVRWLVAGNMMRDITETFISQWLKNDLRTLVEIVDV